MKRNIMILNMAAALIWMAIYIYVPIMPSYAISLGASVVMVGIISGSYGVLQLILRIPLGFFTDRVRKDRLLLVIGFALLALSSLILAVQDGDVWMLVLGRGVSGAASAWWVIISASYSKYMPEDRQVKAQGTLQAFANGGKIVAAVLCAVVAQFFGYHAVFVVSLAIAVFAMLLMFGIKDVAKTDTHPPVPLRQQLALFKNRDIWVFSILAILSQLISFATAGTFTPVAAEALGANSFELGMLLVVFFLFTTLSALLVGSRLYVRLGCIHMMALAFLVGAAACIPALYHTNLFVIYVAQALAGTCYGLTQSVTAGFVIRSVPPAQRGAATGIFQSLFTIGILFGPVALGYIVDATSFDTAYWCMVGVMIFAALLCYKVIPREYRRLT